MTYLLRKIPDDLWIRFKRRCESSGHTIRYVVAQLIAYYADNGFPKSKR